MLILQISQNGHVKNGGSSTFDFHLSHLDKSFLRGIGIIVMLIFMGNAIHRIR